MEKIKMATPIVELDGDEMTRVLWHWIKESLLEPYIDLNIDYYDLHIKNRDNTNDKVTIDAANATIKYGVAVKCATITANKDRKEEYDLKEIWESPNGTIRKILKGTVFRVPIIIESLVPVIPNWKKPITIARHAYGDQYLSVSLEVDEATKAEFILTDKNGSEKRVPIFDFDEKGILMGYTNLDSSIEDFANTCFQYSLDEKTDLMFGAKDTVIKAYDYKFKDIFQKLYDEKYKPLFEEKNIRYTYTLIDDAIAKVVKSNGGMILACKNYEGDLMSDLVAAGFGSLALMTSVLVSQNGYYEYEAAHGTVMNHYYKYLKGEDTSTNPIALIFTWTGGLRKRGELDSNTELIQFSNALEKATIDTINDGILTKDLMDSSSLANKRWVNSREMILLIGEKLKKSLNK